MGELLNNSGSAASATGVADAVHAAAATGNNTAGSMGAVLQSRAAATGVLSSTGYPTNFAALSVATSGFVSITAIGDRVINATNYATGFQPFTSTGIPTNFAALSIATSGHVTIAGTATGAITASSFGAGAITGTVLATDAASKINQYTAGLRGGQAFDDFRFSMLATSGTAYATDQSPLVSLGFGTVAAATVAGSVTAIGNDYIVSFASNELPAGQSGIMRATATGALTREISIITTPAT